MRQELLERIIELLDSHGFIYRLTHHEPTYTSVESARARGEDISIGGKAIVMKIGETFYLFVLSAALKVNSSALKQHFDEKRIRFATPEELLEMAGVVPGAVPPFGKPILPFDIYVDNSILRNERIAFNAGSLTDSIIMNVSDYLKIGAPKILDFSIRG